MSQSGLSKYQKHRLKVNLLSSAPNKHVKLVLPHPPSNYIAVQPRVHQTPIILAPSAPAAQVVCNAARPVSPMPGPSRCDNGECEEEVVEANDDTR